MSTRVYVPVTSTGLATLYADQRLPGPVRAHAVTAALREGWAEANEEEWEFSAMYAAADDSAAAYAAGTDRPRRYVVAADVGLVEAATDADAMATSVVLVEGLVWKQVDAVHADLADGDDGPPDEDGELGWFATQEVGELL